MLVIQQQLGTDSVSFDRWIGDKGGARTRAWRTNEGLTRLFYLTKGNKINPRGRSETRKEKLIVKLYYNVFAWIYIVRYLFLLVHILSFPGKQ